MAKQSNGRGSGSAKVRLIVLEAEIPEGNLSELTQALQNALRPATLIQQRPAPPLLPSSTVSNPTGVAHHEILDDDEAISEVADVPEPAPRKPREARQRRIVSPEVVTDLDLNTEPSWLQFANSANPTTDIDKFLVVAEWCKRHRELSEVSADHVFTCFRRVQWSTNKPDFASTLRSCKARKFMGSGKERGFYTINHLGTSRVDDMIRK